MAVRVVLKIEPYNEATDPDIAQPDSTQQGLRVCRRVSCALDTDKKKTYFLSVAGVSKSVQWLLTASPNAVFFVTATAKAYNDSIDFRAIGFMDVAPIGLDPFVKHMQTMLAETGDAPLEFTPSRATPQSRKRRIDEVTGDSNGGTFSKRRAFT